MCLMAQLRMPETVVLPSLHSLGVTGLIPLCHHPRPPGFPCSDVPGLSLPQAGVWTLPCAPPASSGGPQASKWCLTLRDPDT